MRPLPFRPYADAPRRRRRGSWLPLVLVAAAALFFLFRCSGLHFPMWDPAGHLRGRLATDFGVPLPPTARVTRAAWEAYIDPSEFYVIEMPAADAAAFVAALRPVTEVPPTADPAAATVRIPAWWTPQSLPGMRALQAWRGQALYRWFYADGSGTVYLVRQDT